MSMAPLVWTVPPTPRLWTIPLPRVDVTWGSGGFYDEGDGGGGGEFPAQEVIMSKCLAAAKPKNIENGARSGVSLFYPARNRALY